MQKNNKYILIIGVLAVLSIVVSVYARSHALFPGDVYLLYHLQFSSNRYLFLFMALVSLMFGGCGTVLTIITLLGLVLWRIGKLESLLMIVGALLTGVTFILKPIINTSRPVVDLLINTPAANAFRIVSQQPDNGFPSGHAFFAVMTLGLLAYFSWISMKKDGLRTLVLAGLIAAILLVGVSRVYMGDHWPGDILGGYLIGGVFLTVLIWFHQSWRARHPFNGPAS
jgi:undecaprenyl-diphosphatase